MYSWYSGYPKTSPTVMLESTILPARARLGDVIWKKQGEFINWCDNQEEKLSRREKEPEESNDFSISFCNWWSATSAVYPGQEFQDSNSFSSINLHLSFHKIVWCKNCQRHRQLRMHTISKKKIAPIL